MEIQLGLYGMDMDFAETGEEALEFIKKTVYDIIFLDLMLPGIDGYKVCKVIKSEKMSKNTPVVMLTGKGSRFDKLRGTMAGASVYLTKPVEQEKLKEVIKQFLPDFNQKA
jgi:twitching motility two-component system response regulator PilG